MRTLSAPSKMSSDAVVLEVFMARHGRSKTGPMGTTRELQLGYQRSCFVAWREQQQNMSWMIFAAVIFVFMAKVGLLLH